tara:strand:- start:251 stop:502 length:252 start_codon:yes stop_codon:yes gene_type:complete
MKMINKNSEYKSSNSDLQSSIKSKGKYVTQIIHFIGGEKRTYDGVNVNSIRQGQFTKFECKNGAMVLINDRNVLMIEVFAEKE